MIELVSVKKIDGVELQNPSVNTYSEPLRGTNFDYPKLEQAIRLFDKQPCPARSNRLRDFTSSAESQCHYLSDNLLK